MKAYISKSLVAATITLASVSGWAQGTLTLTGKTGGVTNTLEFAVNSTGGITSGRFNSVVNNILGGFTPTNINIAVDSDETNLDITTPEDNVIQYGSPGTNNALGVRRVLITVNKVANGNLLFFDMHIDNSVTIKDVTGKAEVNGPSKTLKLYWEKNRLLLSSTGSGNCEGSIISANQTLTTFSNCTSTGSLTDAFFNNPDQIITWIVKDYVK